jgi:hypothetical protein
MQISAGSGIPNNSLEYEKFSPTLKNVVADGVVAAALEHVRSLIGGAVTYGTDKADLWGEAYIDSDGRNNSVASATATFSSNKYVRPNAVVTGAEETKSCAGGTNGAVSFVINIPGNAIVTTIGYDGSTGIRNITITDGTSTATKATASNPSGTATFVPSDYSGKGYLTGNVTITIATTNTYTLANQSYAGTLFTATNQPLLASGGLVGVKAVNITTSANIVHTIPSGKYPATISRACFKALITDFETGATGRYKLTNATEDTGWINDGDVGEFTAFTSEPTSLIFELVGKSGTPTINKPASYGLAGVAW